MNQKSHFTLKHALACLCLLPLTLLSLTAQTTAVPGRINYQGQLLDINGNALVDGDYELTFRLWSDKTGGAVVWGPQIFDGQSITGHDLKIPVVDGQFNVILGPTDTAEQNLVDAFNGTSRFLEITIGNSPPITPRQEILSAPFALQAENAVNAENAINASTASALFDGTSEVATANNGNVGIGTSSPSSILHISSGTLGDAVLTLEADTSNENGSEDLNPRIELFQDGGLVGATIGFDEERFGSNRFAIARRYIGTDYNDTFIIDTNNGNVGIGQTNPSQKLTVNGSVFSKGFDFSAIRSSTEGHIEVDGALYRHIAVDGGARVFLTVNDLFHIRKSGDSGGIRKFTFNVDNGHAYKSSGAGDWLSLSDQRVKKDIRDFTDGLETIRQINPVFYKYNGKAGYPNDGQEHVGVIAQDVQAHAPYMFEIFPAKLNEDDTKETDLLMYDSSALVYILVNAVQEQQEIIETLQSEQSNTQQQLEAVMTRLQQLENATENP